MNARPGRRRPGGRLVVFSGLDGAGKSTQIQLLHNYCVENGLRTEYLWSRGGYSRGMEIIKQALRRLIPGKRMPSSGDHAARANAFARPGLRKLWLLAAILDLHRVYGVIFRLWLRQGKVVIADRYLVDTQIDFRLNFPVERVEKWRSWRFLERLAPKPDLAFMLLVPVAVSLRRSDEKKEPYRDSPEALSQRLEFYQQAADQTPWIVLDGLRPVDELAGQIRMEFERLLPSCLAQPDNPRQPRLLP